MGCLEEYILRTLRRHQADLIKIIVEAGVEALAVAV